MSYVQIRPLCHGHLVLLMRTEPATLTPALSQRAREGETTCFLSLLLGRKALT
jgi:hypothetical protein